MDKKNRSSRRVGTTGMKVLIATGSVAATVIGWALVPANNPTPVGAAPQNSQGQVPAPSFDVPGTQNNSGFGSLPQAPDNQQPSSSNTAPDPNLPQIQLPQNSSSFPMPFTRSHSSR